MSAATASRRAVVVLALAAVAALVGAGAAQAHNTLVSTDPVDGSTVAVAPPRVTLTFNEPARSLGTEVVVTAPDGTTVSTGDPVVDGAAVSQDLSGALPAGAYTVTWRVTSADGHPLEGVLSFTATGATTVGGAAAVTPTPSPTPTSTPTPTPSTTAPAATASIAPVAPAGGAEIGPLVTDQDADDDGTLSGVVVAAVAAVVLVLVVAGTVLVRHRRARALRSRSARS
ncbi:copper resistance CopC family protein [Cellulomonas sp. WB94]|uniref:copper resistance CopC family protein n=1 Tax=Cellulomonas sp. WB94 TaxID=2173174 RepID=UPI001304A8D6|nr:copper resistance CopC family protein [Cellulomonas sp. WB94]